MNCKAILFAIMIWLVPWPSLAQKFSPIIIETGKPTPSIVKTGEPFKVTYTVKFLDTVIIQQERMRPDNLVLEKVEVVNLEIKERDREDNPKFGYLNVWDFIYTFRIISPEKGLKKIPTFNFYWYLKSAGITKEKTEEKAVVMERETDEVGVGYISSIAKPPPLDIRDKIRFQMPIWDSSLLRRIAYGIIGIGFILTLAIVYLFLRIPKVRDSQSGEQKGVIIESSSEPDNHYPIYNLTQRKFIFELKQIQIQAPVTEAEERVRDLVRQFLLSEFCRRGIIKDSMSSEEIHKQLEQNKNKIKNAPIVINLAEKLKLYQKDIDSGQSNFDNSREIDDLLATAKALKQSIFRRLLKKVFKREGK